MSRDPGGSEDGQKPARHRGWLINRPRQSGTLAPRRPCIADIRPDTGPLRPAPCVRAYTAPASESSQIIELNGPLSTEGFSQARLGSTAAAKALGVSYEDSAPPGLTNFVSDYSTLIREAIARHPAAMVIGNFIPSAFDPLIQQATRAGIPVVVVNSADRTSYRREQPECGDSPTGS
jgi:hypothetical protein